MTKHILISLLVIILILFFSAILFGQHNNADTIIANRYLKLALEFQSKTPIDSAIFYAQKARVLYSAYFGEKSVKNANVLNLLGRLYYDQDKNDLSLEYYLNSLVLRREMYGEKHVDVAESYNNVGIVYNELREYNKALNYYFKSAELYKELLGENHVFIATIYKNIGISYGKSGEYEKSLEYHFRALDIRRILYGEKHTSVANSYAYISSIYFSKGEYDQALEYSLKTLNIRKEILGDNHPYLADSYSSVGQIYRSKGDYDKSLENNFSALQIRKEITGENDQEVADCYTDIGLLYEDSGKLDKALEYHFRSLNILIEIGGEANSSVAGVYNTIGNVFEDKGEYDKALEYHLKALELRKETLGENDVEVAASYNNIGIVYGDKGECEKALEFHFRALKIYTEHPSVNQLDISLTYSNIGINYDDKGEYEKALQYYFKALVIDRSILGEKHKDVLLDYSNIGVAYREKGEYSEALVYQFKVLSVLNEDPAKNKIEIAGTYFNIGAVYQSKGEFEKALEYDLKALQIKKEILGINHPEIAAIYNNLGLIYDNKGEYDKALEYHFMALQLVKAILGENHPDAARSYNNIGRIYNNQGEYEKALKYYSEALKIYKETYGESHPDIASELGNIGLIYSDKGEFDQALDYLNNSMKMKIGIFGEKHPSIANAYDNLGRLFQLKGENAKSLDQYLKALEIRKIMLGEKHPDLAKSYNNIGNIYHVNGEYDKELEYYQKSISSCLLNYKDINSSYSVPAIIDFLSWADLLFAIHSKAHTIADSSITLSGVSKSERKEIALRHYQSCDTLIDIVRKEISSQSDKLALGEKASQVYKEAIDMLTSTLSAAKNTPAKSILREDAEMAFYFSEKNKSSVLLEALAGQEAIKFAGIPDSLLQKEQRLKNNISFYTKSLAESGKLTVTQTALYKNYLFSSNRSYDSLIYVFENKFPEYYNLKYNNKPVTVKDIQKLLDSKTEMLSYAVGDSMITVFSITRNSLKVKNVPKIKYLNDSILWFRYGLTLTSTRMKSNYKRLGYTLYKQFFPDNLLSDKRIENLVIVPDGNLATIPFESLLTCGYEGILDDYKSYPFLIKKYDISYTYSANLYVRTFSKEVSSTVKVTKLNDWLAFAPVFDDDSGRGKALSTRELVKQQTDTSDSTLLSRSMFDRNFVSPLPATETETETIFKLFDDRNLKASVLLHGKASEQFIKSGGLNNYRIIHFATHGFVNASHPELSGLLLAKDSTGIEDGILYSGELFNLKLKADLVVLSACETGLGKIQRGEGIIGLTRALLYAGANNIIVSLWQVADESTSDLMVDFYKNRIENRGDVSYASALRTAKLSMIDNGKYSHPLFWSPFILIGR